MPEQEPVTDILTYPNIQSVGVVGLVEHTGPGSYTKRPIGVGHTTHILTRGLADARFAALNQAVPAGGSTGQVLKKVSGTDYDYSWQADATGGGGGGGSIDDALALDALL